MPRRACTLLAVALAAALFHGRFVVPWTLEPDPREREVEELRDDEERRQLRLIKEIAAGVVWHF